MRPQSRSRTQRKHDALGLLERERTLWIATVRDDQAAHLIPLAFVWDGITITIGTAVESPTGRSLNRTGRARVAVGHAHDLVIVEGPVTTVPPTRIDPALADKFARVSLDPRNMPGYAYFQLTPNLVQAWRSFAEYRGRTLMRDGRWLE